MLSFRNPVTLKGNETVTFLELLYVQVKFMKTIPGTALVEMGDEYAVERAVTHLNNVKLFGKRLNVW